jgi:phosphoglycolate phosphatase-like HAD superfamily hydrolase
MRESAERPQPEGGEARPAADAWRAPYGDRKGILLDFDHTLFDTDRFFWVDLKSAFARFGIPDEAWEQSYEAIWPSGYSLAKHVEDLARRGVISEPGAARAMLNALQTTFSDLRSYVFADVLEFLDGAHRLGFDLMLLSFGDPAWQSFKVGASGLAPTFQQIVYTPEHEGKAGLLDDLVPRYVELHAIDNNPADLDAMKARHPRLQTHLISRVDPSAAEGAHGSLPYRFREAARYLSVPSRLPHHRCLSLGEIRPS